VNPKTPPAETKSSLALVVSVVFAALGLGIGIAAVATSIPLAGGTWLFASWILVSIISISVAALALRARQFHGIGVAVVPLLFGSAGFGPGTLMLVNRIGAGNGEPRAVTVTAHRAHTAKGQTSYYVSLAPFPPLTEPLELEVSASVYGECTRKPGQAGTLRVAMGKLGWPFVVQWGEPELGCGPQTDNTRTEGKY
jgi:hypothetical protein